MFNIENNELSSLRTRRVENIVQEAPAVSQSVWALNLGRLWLELCTPLEERVGFGQVWVSLTLSLLVFTIYIVITEFSGMLYYYYCQQGFWTCSAKFISLLCQLLADLQVANHLTFQCLLVLMLKIRRTAAHAFFWQSWHRGGLLPVVLALSVLTSNSPNLFQMGSRSFFQLYN